jgi:hypothetical protein
MFLFCDCECVQLDPELELFPQNLGCDETENYSSTEVCWRIKNQCSSINHRQVAYQ